MIKADNKIGVDEGDKALVTDDILEKYCESTGDCVDTKMKCDDVIDKTVGKMVNCGIAEYGGEKTVEWCIGVKG